MPPRLVVEDPFHRARLSHLPGPSRRAGGRATRRSRVTRTRAQEVAKKPEAASVEGGAVPLCGHEDGWSHMAAVRRSAARDGAAREPCDGPPDRARGAGYCRARPADRRRTDPGGRAPSATGDRRSTRDGRPRRVWRRSELAPFRAEATRELSVRNSPREPSVHAALQGWGNSRATH